MSRIFKFIAGNSIVTPLGIAAAALLVILLRAPAAPWTPFAFAGVLLATLIASTFERVS